MATIPTIQLFRNSIIKTGRQAAIDALEAQKASVPDGGLILARYSKDGTENGVKTLLGIVRNSGSANAELTVIDVEGAAENVQSAITSAINGLNKPDNAVEGEYVSSVSEDKGIITVTRKPLPSFGEKSDSGKAITAITQTNGEVSVKFGGVAAANVSVADEGNKITATNVEGALLEIKDSLDAAIGVGGTVAEQITNAINGISGTTEITDGKVITAISQTNGKVSVTAATLGADKVSASTITDDGTKVAVNGDNVKAQIESLATSIKTVSGDAKSYSIKAISGEELTALGANVREAYKLVDEDEAQAGAAIKIYRDSSLKSVALDGQTLNFTYILADGTEKTVGVDVSTFLAESEFKDGLEVVDGIVKVKKDARSEKFLSVSESGVKLDGVQAAINTAAAAATTKVEKTDGGSHVTLSHAPNTDGSVTYTISESDIASANALIDETNARQTQDNKIEAAVGLDAEGNHITPTGNYTKGATTVVGEIAALDTKLKEVSDTLGTGVSTAEGKTVTEQLQALSGTTESLSGDTSVEGAKKYTDSKIGALILLPVGGNGKVITRISQANGVVKATATTLSAESVSASPIDSGNATVAVTGTNVSAQISSLAKSIKSASTAAAAAHTKVEAKTDGHVTVSIAKSEDGSHDIVTIAENDIASARALETETTNRQNADTELSNRLGDDVTTDLTATAQLRALSGSSIDGKTVTSVYGAKAYAKDLVENLDADVESTTESTTETTTTKAIRIKQTDGKIASITLGAFDCGTY